MRLKTQRDPNQTLRTRNYDPAGRVTSHTLSTGREDTYAYDDNDNPRVIVRRVNSVAVATTSLTYDALDRVTRIVDPHSQSVDYGFDALSRVVSVTYPGNHTLTNRYDALSRLTSQVDWAARQMSYDYDKAGRLIRRAYPNGVVQTNTFDSAGHLTSLGHVAFNAQSSTINIALTYAYDRNGNKTGNSERGTLAWPMPSLHDETAQFTPSGRITNKVDTASTINNWTYHFDPSGNMTNAASVEQSYALTYDEDNRVTSLFWDYKLPVQFTKLITNRYDALGRRIARKVDGVETRYVLDLSGGMERILCDTTASGQVTAYYIHGPDLCYRVDATNNVLCYHADAQANIIAVTDGGGTNVAQYAYTPYGRSLGSTNCQQELTQLSANPFLFVGSQGVMEDLPGLYFMRARYYSADAGVFLSTEPKKNIGPTWRPIAYAYGINNPLGGIDPNGRSFLSMISGAVNSFISSVVSFVQNVVTQISNAGAKAATAAAKPSVQNNYSGGGLGLNTPGQTPTPVQTASRGGTSGSGLQTQPVTVVGSSFLQPQVGPPKISLDTRVANSTPQLRTPSYSGSVNPLLNPCKLPDNVTFIQAAVPMTDEERVQQALYKKYNIEPGPNAWKELIQSVGPDSGARAQYWSNLDQAKREALGSSSGGLSFWQYLLMFGSAGMNVIESSGPIETEQSMVTFPQPMGR